jgi:hypothetical protein
MTVSSVRVVAVLSILLAWCATALPVAAVPSFARELGVPCATCHSSFPQLNAFGRQFKLNGYVLGTSANNGTKGQDSDGHQTLSLDSFPPLSVMLEAAVTGLQKSVPDTQNNNVELPQQASLFFAGRIGPQIGSFVQLTYSQADGKIALDNAEIRYAKSATLNDKPVTFGAFINNSPTLEDLWNTTAAWRFPWVGPSVVPDPAAAPLIDGALAQDVMGVGGFASFHGKFYVASGLYRSAHVGSSSPTADSENTIANAALYWRLAWQRTLGKNYIEFGTYGLHTRLHPQGLTGQTDNYADYSVDTQLERPVGSRTFIVHGSYTRENQDLNASFAADLAEQQSYQLGTLRLDAGLQGPKLGYMLGVARTTGDTDTVRFASEATTGSVSGKPDSTALIGEVIYSPLQNVQLRLQYRHYARFNGATTNYDGFGRNAADNDTLMLHAWFAW